MKLGFALAFRNTPIRKVVDLARRAERKSFDAFLVAEAWRETIVPMTALALGTERIQIGSATALGFTASPTTLSLQALQLDELSGGRLLLSIGLGTPMVVENWYGAAYDQPASRMRELLMVMNGIQGSAGGESFSFSGKFYRIHRYRAPFQPVRQRVPVYLAAVGPRMQRIAGECAEGILVGALHSRRYFTEEIFPNLERGARQAGRDPSAIGVAYYLPCAVHPNRNEAYRRVRNTLMYVAQYPHYLKVYEAEGFGEEAAAINAALQAKDYGRAAGAVTDAMVAQFAVAGDPDEVREQIRRYEWLNGMALLNLIPFRMEESETIENVERLIEVLGRA